MASGGRFVGGSLIYYSLVILLHWPWPGGEHGRREYEGVSGEQHALPLTCTKTSCICVPNIMYSNAWNIIDASHCHFGSSDHLSF